MNDKLQHFIHNAFEPYGAFPARKEVEQELLANLTEKYSDLQAEGKTDEEAYSLTVASLGDVSEIMEHVAHDYETTPHETAQTPTPHDTRFRATSLIEADLTDTQLSGSDFSMSALNRANFAKS